MPDWKGEVKQRLASLNLEPARENSIFDELSQHLEDYYNELLSGGATPLEAARLTLAELSESELLTRELRRAAPLPEPVVPGMTRRKGILAGFWLDLRYGVRVLTKSPGVNFIALLSLTLGIGLTTAIFSLTYSILLRALPYPEPERLVAVWNTSSAPAAASLARGIVGANSATWMDWREQSRLFEDIAITRVAANFNLTGDGPPERVQGARTSWNVSQVLGVQPLVGRMFTEEETLRDAKVAALSFGFWDRRFARDPDILGRIIQLNGEPFEVIGVMPPSFRYPTKDVDLLAPLFISPAEIQSRMGFQYRAVGRLKPGVSLQQAQAEMSTIMQRLARQYPASNGANQLGVLVEPLLDSTVGQFRTTLYVLLGAVGSLLLIGCINLGGLLVIRASARSREFAIRAALGASAARLQRQMLAELLPLSAAGAAGGVVIAWCLLRILVPWLPPQLPGLEAIGLHRGVLAFALVLSVLTVLLAGMLPARLATRVQLSAAMKQDSLTIAGGRAMRNALVAAQIAVTLVLVFAGALLVRSLVAVMRVHPGFSTGSVLTMQLTVTRAKYPTEPQVADYYRRLVARARTIPGVIEAGMINFLPFSGSGVSGPVEVEGNRDEGRVAATFLSVTSGCFSAMGIPLIRGRDFSDQDREGSQPVGIIDEQLARILFGDSDPLGRRFRFGAITENTPWIEVVGVVGHIRMGSLETDPRPQLYWPTAQIRPEVMQNQPRGALVVRTDGPPESFASAVVEHIHQENPDQPVYDVRSMESWLDQSLRSRHLLTGLVLLFGGAALLLACVGVYGVVSYTAAQRSKEFAIRTALGAEPGDVRRLVLAHALRLWISGSFIGLVAALPAGRVLMSQLYGVVSTDVLSLTVAPSVLLVIALLAGLGPARRAGSVDPAVALRGE